MWKGGNKVVSRKEGKRKVKQGGKVESGKRKESGMWNEGRWVKRRN